MCRYISRPCADECLCVGKRGWVAIFLSAHFNAVYIVFLNGGLQRGGVYVNVGCVVFYDRAKVFKRCFRGVLPVVRPEARGLVCGLVLGTCGCGGIVTATSQGNDGAYRRNNQLAFMISPLLGN